MQALIQKLHESSIQLRAESGQLRVLAPQGRLTPDLREAIQTHKAALLQMLATHGDTHAPEPAQADPATWHEPFELSEIQHAYWLGSQPFTELGGVRTLILLETERPALDHDRLQASLQKMIARHGMLRAVIGTDGTQRVLPDVPAYPLAVHDLGSAPPAVQADACAQLRQRLLRETTATEHWPPFTIEIAKLGRDAHGERIRLFVCVDLMVFDASSLMLFGREWARFYADPHWSPPALQFSYRDYVVHERGAEQTAAFQRARDYWTGRLDDLPPAPDLPLATAPAQLSQVAFSRRHARLDVPTWQALKEGARRHGATPAVLLLTAYAETLRTWAQAPDFTLNLTMFNRKPVHPDVGRLIGDFTTTLLLSSRHQPGDSFLDAMLRTQRQLGSDLAHAQYSGIRVLRDLARHHGRPADGGMPVVFTSTLSLDAGDEQDSAHAFLGDYVSGLSQTPQVWLDHQMLEREGRLDLAWDAVDALFPPGLLDDMFASYVARLERLAADDAAWTVRPMSRHVPPWQLELQRAVNDTATPIAARLLQDLAWQAALQHPHAPAVITPDTMLGHAELHRQAFRLARRLRSLGARPNTLVAVSMDKGWEQVAAILGVLHAGAAYLPVDPRLPRQRRDLLLARGEATLLVTQAHLAGPDHWPPHIGVITLQDEDVQRQHDGPVAPVQAPDDLAYVLFTSGSTGEPKGVMISHAAAANTVQDINARFGITAADRVLALSSASFDLSVHDIFGLLAAGAALVLPAPERLTDPAHWTELVRRHAVTVWNSVPQLLQLWVDVTERATPVPGSGAAHPLRLALLSGDWIPTTLPDRARRLVPGLQVVSLGGATEASIWSIAYPIGEVDPRWKSIPYGRALANQTVQVLDEGLQPRPVWAVGQIHIGGAGVAQGYWRDEERTRQSFVASACGDGRLYRTGDLGRLLPDGHIEFLGRCDTQLKLNGNRVEAGEIEAALRQLPGVAQALVHLAPPAEGGKPQLVAYVVAASPGPLAVDELLRQLQDRLPAYMVPPCGVQLPALPLTPNGKVDHQALPPPARAAAALLPQREPANEIERRLLAVWRRVLRHDGIGLDQRFFEAGGNSLDMVQLLSALPQELQLAGVSQQELTRLFFAHPTIASFAQAVAQLPPTGAQDPAAPEAAPALPTIVPDPDHRHQPFPLSALQRAYAAGRIGAVEYHTDPDHYLEFDHDEAIDPARFETALNAVLYRQRASLPVLTADLQLQVPAAYQPVVLTVSDWRDRSTDDAQAELQALRQRLCAVSMPLEQWPWLAVHLSLCPGWSRVHVNVSNFFMDAFGLLCLEDVKRLYDDPRQLRPEPGLSFRDAVLACEGLAASPLGERDRQYWTARLPTLPGAPALPLRHGESPHTRSWLERREFVLPAASWSALQQQAARHQLTPTAAIQAAYAQVLATWSGSRHFILGNMVSQRLPLHPDMLGIIGNLAAVYPLEIDWREPAPFSQRARMVQEQAARDLQATHWDSARLWQAINQRDGSPGRAASPFVIAGGLNLPARAKPAHARIQTPQVLVDHQFWHLAGGGLWIVWDVNERFLPPGLVDAMWDAYQALLRLLAHDETAWLQTSFDLLPPAQRARRRQLNDTAGPVPTGRLHDALARGAAAHPHRQAVLTPSRSLRYAELHDAARQLAACLQARGVQPGHLVAVLLDKGWEQVVAVHGVLAAGAAYVPLDPAWPDARIEAVLHDTGARLVLAGRQHQARVPGWPRIDPADPTRPADAACDPPHAKDTSPGHAEDLAYVIYTSGSTGRPKGVMVDHQAALNTIEDINHRLGIGPQDRVFGVSSLSFDLSVHDLFGTLAAGATLVLPDAGRSLEPRHWLALVQTHEVSVWNSVPALAQLLVDAAEEQGVKALPLKTVMLSGDWIPLPLLPRLRAVAPAAALHSLGGATEAAIWSIHHPIGAADPQGTSVPYGRPLANQTWHVLDDQGDDVPEWTTGHLHIGGLGLARGYWRDEARTAASFIRHPRTGERLYRTGDLGRMLPDGHIELLGRSDLQVKVRGHRIELGEIEHALLAVPGVGQAAALTVDTDTGRHLQAFVVAEPGASLDTSDWEHEAASRLRRQLPAHMVPTRITVLKELPLTPNGKTDRSALAARARRGQPAPHGPATPRTPTEAAMADLWQQVLGVPAVALHDDFFALGGQSLSGLQLIGRINRQLGAALTLADLLECRTVQALARRLAEAGQRSLLVPLAKPSGACRVPLVLVHPAGGNVLCYRELAQALAQAAARPVLGLRARAPAERIPDRVEQIAAEYARDLEAGLPDGPLALGGWSSGGLIAFELGRQLQRLGRRVLGLVLLDAPAPWPHPPVPDATLQQWFRRDARLDPASTLSAELLDPFRTYEAILRATRRYQPEKQPENAAFDALVLKARECGAADLALHPAAARDDWGWSGWIDGRVHSSVAEGDHHALLDARWATQTAAVIQRWLDDREKPR